MEVDGGWIGSLNGLTIRAPNGANKQKQNKKEEEKGQLLLNLARKIFSSLQVEAGCELFVHYQYLLSDCPRWYEELYNQL